MLKVLGEHKYSHPNLFSGKATPSLGASECLHFADQHLECLGQAVSVLGMSPSDVIRAEMQMIGGSCGDCFRRLVKRIAGGNESRDSST